MQPYDHGQRVKGVHSDRIPFKQTQTAGADPNLIRHSFRLERRKADTGRHAKDDVNQTHHVAGDALGAAWLTP